MPGGRPQLWANLPETRSPANRGFSGLDDRTPHGRSTGTALRRWQHAAAALAHHRGGRGSHAAPDLPAGDGPGRRCYRQAVRRRDEHAWREHALLALAAPAGRGRQDGGRHGRRHALRVHHDLGFRRRVDEPPGHAHEPDVARTDRRFDRTGDARPRLRRTGRLCRMRQDAARNHDGDGAARTARRCSCMAVPCCRDSSKASR